MRDCSYWMPTTVVGILYGLRCCNKGIEEWLDNTRHITGDLVPWYRTDQLSYYYEMRELHLDALKAYRR